MVQRTHEIDCQRHRQHGVTQQAEATAGRRHEARALAGFVDDLARGADALGAVVGQQLLAGQALDHVGQVPAQRLRVLEAGVGAAHAEDRQQVGGVAGEDDVAMHIIGQRQRACGVDRAPVHFPRHAGVADHGQLGVDALGQGIDMQCLLGRFARGQLVVQAPDAVRFAVHQDRVARVPFGVEEGQALGRQRQVDLDVGDDEEALVGGAFHPQAHVVTDAGTAAGGIHQPVGFELVLAFGRVDGDVDVAVLLRHGRDLVAPAEIDQRIRLAGIVQILFHVLLLHVDHRVETVIRILHAFHAEHALATVVGVAVQPRQAAFGHAVSHANLLQDFHRAAREHDGAAALREL